MDDIRRLLESFDQAENIAKDTQTAADPGSDLQESMLKEYESFLSEQAAPVRPAARGFMKGLERGAAAAEREAAAAERATARAAGRAARPQYLPKAEVDREAQALGARAAQASRGRPGAEITPPTRKGSKGKPHRSPDEAPKRVKQKGEPDELPRGTPPKIEPVARPQERPGIRAANEPAAIPAAPRSTPAPRPGVEPAARPAAPRPDLPAVVRRRNQPVAGPSDVPLPARGGRPVEVPGVPSVVRTPRPEAPAAPRVSDPQVPAPAARPGVEPAPTPRPGVEPAPAAPVLPKPEIAPVSKPGSVEMPGSLPEISTGPGPRLAAARAPAASGIVPRIATGAGLTGTTFGPQLPGGGGSGVPPITPPVVGSPTTLPGGGGGREQLPEPTRPRVAAVGGYPDLPEIDVAPEPPFAKLDLTEPPAGRAPSSAATAPSYRSGDTYQPSPGAYDWSRTAAPAAPMAEPPRGSFVRTRTPDEIARGATQGTGYLRSRYADRVRTGIQPESRSRQGRVIESIKQEFEQFVLDEAQVLNFPKKPAAPAPMAAPQVKTTSTAARPQSQATTAPTPAPATAAQKVQQAAAAKAQQTGKQFKGELGGRWNRGFSALSGYDEYTRRRAGGQSVGTSLAGAGIVAGSELLGTAGGAALGSVVPIPGATLAGGIYGATKGYEAGRSIGDRLLGSPGEEAEGEVTKAIGKVAEPVGAAVGKAAAKLKAAPPPGFRSDDQSYF